MSERDEGRGDHLKAVEFHEARFERMVPIMTRIYDLENAAFRDVMSIDRYAHGEAVRTFVDAADQRTYTWGQLVRQVAGIPDEDWTRYLDMKHREELGR